MAKCKHWNYCMLDADLRKSGKCRGKDPSCDIIPKKPKTNSVKGWAEIVGKGRLIAYSFKPSGKVFPCTITYQVKGAK